MAKDIIAGLKKLDTTNDQHWTKEGTPMLSILGIYAGDKVSSDELATAAPGFNRETAASYFAAAGEQNGAGAGVPPAPAVPPLPGAAVPPAPPLPGAAEGAATGNEGAKNDPADPGAGADAGDSATGDSGNSGNSADANAGGSNLSELEQRLFDAEEDLRMMAEAQDRLNEARKEATAKRDAIVREMEAEKAANPENPIMGYLQSQERLRQARGERLTELRQAGVTAKMIQDLVPQPSKLDQALRQRRNTK